MKTQNRNNRGFTLIELTFVAFLFLLLAGLAASRFRGSFDAFSEKTAVDAILDLMNFAHERAILERIDYGVHLAPEQNAYWLVREKEESPDSELERISGTLGSSHRWPAGVTYSGAEQSIRFYPDGTTESASVDLACHTRRVTIAMDPVSGKGVVHEALD